MRCTVWHISLLALLVYSACAASKFPKAMREFDRLSGDGGHNQAFPAFDQDRSQSISVEEAKRWGVEQRWLAYYDKNLDGALDYSEFVSFFRERKLFHEAADLFDLTLQCDEDGMRCRTVANKPTPKGHLEELGSHGEPVPIDIVDDASLKPEVFWKEYIGKHKPVLFRGVDSSSIAAKYWDEEYVANKFGHVDLKLEPKLESRGDNSAYKEIDSLGNHHRMNISEFINGEDNMRNRNMYAVTIIPQDMAWEVTVPPSVMCGSRTTQTNPRDNNRQAKHPFPHATGKDWLTHIYEANLWLAHGRTRSQLHYDKENNMNCLYKGEKEWILMDTRQHYHDLLWNRGGRYSGENDLLNKGTDWVPIDPDRVDLVIHHRMANVSFQRVTQRAGDCIFLPYSLLHWVNKTDPGFQVAVSYMWLPQEVYSAEACAKSPFPAQIPLAAYDVLWYFDGKGVIPQGYPDPMEIVRELWGLMDERSEDWFTPKTLNAWLQNGESPLRNSKKRQKEFWKEFTVHAAEPKRGLTKQEMLWPNTPLSLWLKLCAEGDPEGMLPCDDGQTYIPRPPAEEERMEQSLQELLKLAKHDEL